MENDNVLYKGWLELVERKIDGRRSEIVKLKPAVAALIYNNDDILLVKQFRSSIKQEIWEIPAGMMDVDGENPCDCLARELKEEADVEIDPNTLVKLVSYYPAVGCLNHNITIFKAEVVDRHYDNKLINDADVTEAKWFNFKDVFSMIKEGQIIDEKTIIGFTTYMTM